MRVRAETIGAAMMLLAAAAILTIIALAPGQITADSEGVDFVGQIEALFVAGGIGVAGWFLRRSARARREEEWYRSRRAEVSAPPEAPPPSSTTVDPFFRGRD